MTLSSRDSRPPAPLVQTSPAALAVVGIAVVLLFVLGWLALRELGAGVDKATEQVGGMVSAAKEALGPDQAAPASVPSAEPAPISTPEPAPPAPPPPPAGTGLAQLQYAIAQCVPTLAQFAEGVRLIAVDASPTNVDFVQESAGTPGRFVRMTCTWNGASFDLSDAGKMIVPPREGDTAKMPPRLLEHGTLSGEWFADRAKGAGASPEAVRRVEVAYVGGRGPLTRVSIAAAGGAVSKVLLGPRGEPLGGDVFFPRVERFREFSDAAAAQAAMLEGFRDQGETTWSSGVGDSLAQMQTKYFEPSEKMISLEFVSTRATVVLPDGSGAKQVMVDAYGDRAEPQPGTRYPHYCAKPFGFRDARIALDAAIRERGETAAQFEAREFQYAIIDCLVDAKRPSWRFE